MNLLDIDLTPPSKVFSMVSEKAAARGIAVLKSEIVGLIPERAIWQAASDALKLDQPLEAHLLEARIREALGPALDGWIDQLASTAPAPGGGSAAALAGALAAALVAMVSRITSSRKAYASVAPEFAEIAAEADSLRLKLRDLVDRDAQAYQSVMAAYRLPQETEEQRRRRQEEIDRALLQAAEVPLETARAAASVLRLARRCAEAGYRSAMADSGVAALLAEAALRGAVYNVEVNVRSLSDPAKGERLSREARDLDLAGREQAAAAAKEVGREILKPVS
jgi:glutamate formiminotransferase/formiminotetrahydrofolate cyclodeaminase